MYKAVISEDPARERRFCMIQKNYEELEMKDDFMFGKVMGNRELCRRILETLLEIPIDAVEYPEQQKTIRITSGGKSVRLDVYVEDCEGTVYDAEMQQNATGILNQELPKRSRYYQGMIDLNLLEKGVPYQELKECYIIFICTFDPFGKGRHKYTFQNLCKEEQSLVLEDRCVKVFFNTKGTQNDVSDEVSELLRYLDTKESCNELTRQLDAEVEKVRSNEMWRREYMKSLLYEMDIRNEGRAEGREEGREIGIKAIIEMCREFEISKEETIHKIMEKFSVSKEQAEGYYIKYLQNEAINEKQ